MDTDKFNRWLTLTANLGILIGLVLLIVEIRQNTDLVRAQIAMDRTTSSIETLINVANSGAIAPINAGLHADVAGFPMVLGWRGKLTQEEGQRYRWWLQARLYEFNNDWFQCTEGLVPAETCERELSNRMLRSIHRFYEFRIDFRRYPQSFIKEMQEIARQEDLPKINDDGTWD